LTVSSNGRPNPALHHECQFLADTVEKLQIFQLDKALCKRRIREGRAPIRTVLFMAMLSAIQHNPVIKRFYENLVGQGKHKKGRHHGLHA